MKYDIIVSVDAGINGGIAVHKHGKLIHVEKMPKRKIKEKNAVDVHRITQILTYLKGQGTVIAVVEHLSMWKGEDPARQFGIQKMLFNHRDVTTTIKLNEIPLIEPHARTWQKHFNTPKKMEKQERKRWLKEVAKIYYPDVNCLQEESRSSELDQII